MFGKLVSYAVLICSVLVSGQGLTASMPGTANASPLRVALVSPEPAGQGFWHHYKQAMQAAADDLAIELLIYDSAGYDRFSHLTAVEKALQANNKPDYLVTVFKKKSAHKMLELLAENKIKFFATSSEVPDHQVKLIGEPRNTFPNWIGHLAQDDVAAGNLLAEKLIALSRQQHNKVNIVGISGSRDSTVASQRNLGLKQYASQSPHTRLMQVFFTDWDYRSSKEIARPILERYPNTSAIWCASDALALGFLDAISPSERKRLVVGGMDWIDLGIQHYESGTLDISLGGHFIEGALILALIRDHFDGVDFAPNLGKRINMKLSQLDQDNLPIIKALVQHDQWQRLDFSLLSQSQSGKPRFWSDEYGEVIEHLYQAPAQTKSRIPAVQ